MYGFDIILDHKLKPWLLEINVLPSLSASSKMDRRIKTSLMTDIFGTIGIIPYSKKKLDRLEEDSKWKRFSGITKAQSKFTKQENIQELIEEIEATIDRPDHSPLKIRSNQNVIAQDQSDDENRPKQLNSHHLVAQS